MSEQLKEALSAVVDGEADEFELRRVLDEIGRSPDLSDSWRRYHLIGEHLRGERSPLSEPELGAMADAVWRGAIEGADDLQGGLEAQASQALAALPNIPETQAGAAVGSQSTLKRWAPVALAASLALVVTLGFLNQEPATQTPAVAEASYEVEGPVIQLRTEVSPSDVRRANAYMLHHVQQKAMNHPGVAGFVKVVTFEKAQ